ncbi:MAG: phage tail sheath family protein, partial [Hungatella sp.]
MGYNHRIDTRETKTQITIPIKGTAGLQVVVGTAPVNMAEDYKAAVNVPVIAYSFTEAQKQLGYSDDFAKYTLCQAMDASFRVFAVAPVIFINVLDPEKHKKEYRKDNIAVIAKKAEINEVGIILKTLEIKDQAEAALTMDTDYIASFNASGGIDITLLSTEKTVAVTNIKASGIQIDPSMVTENDIIGGYDIATGKETGLEVIRQVYPKFGLVPGIILTPGWSQKPAVAAVMCAKTERVNGIFTCEAAIDIDTVKVKVYTALKEEKEELAISNDHAILLWPKVRLGKKVYAFSAVWAAMTAYTDVQNNDIPLKSPSNEPLHMGAAVLEDGTDVILDTTMAEMVNSFGIVTAINDGGWKSWGNNTAAYPMIVDPKD